MSFKKWEIRKENKELAGILADECGVSALVASILVGRGHTAYADAMQFLSSEETFSSPFTLPDMDRAVERIWQAIDGGEHIVIYGDYDCDGITSTAVLYTYLLSAGADAEAMLPERDAEGYGLHRSSIERLAASGTKLLITVDNGISALEEIAYAASLGIDTVVTDHHQPGEVLPEAVAVVDPHRKDSESAFRDYAGVGVVFQLIAALEDGDHQAALEYFGDLIAVGTIGDVVPLVGENRAIVQYGLRALAMSNNVGLCALMRAAGVRTEKLTAQTVAFSIAPRINAAGRMGSARLALELLLSEEEEEAEELAFRLDAMNKARQSEEQKITAQVEEMLAADRKLLDGRLLILKHAGWNHGIIGIVCSRLVETYGKPVLLITEEDGVLTGSARSVGDFHLFKALSANAGCLIRYGGHKMAAGFSLESDRFAEFACGMERYAAENHEFMPQLAVTVDKAVALAELTPESVESLQVLEPFGAENPAPLFLLRGMKIAQITPLSEDRHQKLSVRSGTDAATVLCFGVRSRQLFYRVGDTVDLVVSAEISEYQGRKSVSYRMRDMRPSGFAQEKFFAAKAYYERIRRGEDVSKPILLHAMPSREETAQVYRFLRQNGGFAGDEDQLFALFAAGPINACKLRLLLDILEESGLISRGTSGGITLLPAEEKVDLNAAPTMAALQKKVANFGGV